MNDNPKPAVFRDADPETITRIRALVAASGYGALATIEPETGHPVATRVGLAVLEDGSPLIFVSMLAAHTPALLADPRCSLLIGEVGRGDPVAHRRSTLFCRAERIERQTMEGRDALNRYLTSNPKAKLYAGLPDFILFRLKVERLTYNGGFGKAFLASGEAYYGE